LAAENGRPNFQRSLLLQPDLGQFADRIGDSAFQVGPAIVFIDPQRRCPGDERRERILAYDTGRYRIGKCCLNRPLGVITRIKVSLDSKLTNKIIACVSGA